MRNNAISYASDNIAIKQTIHNVKNLFNIQIAEGLKSTKITRGLSEAAQIILFFEVRGPLRLYMKELNNRLASLKDFIFEAKALERDKTLREK
jgi:hypothetical protein